MLVQVQRPLLGLPFPGGPLPAFLTPRSPTSNPTVPVPTAPTSPSPSLDDAPFVQLCHRADPRCPTAPGWHWWLCHAHPQRSHLLARDLRARDVPHLIPVRRVERRRANRSTYTVDEPLFAGYVFLAGEEIYAAHEALHAVPGRLRVVSHVEDAGSLCRDLGRLLDAIDAGAPVGRAVELVPGRTRVRVTGGVLEGWEGTYLRDARRGVLLLDVAYLRRSVEVEVEAWQVEAIGP